MGRARRQCRGRGEGVGRRQRDRARQARPAVERRRGAARSSRRPATTSRPRRRSARSCSICRAASGPLADRIVTTSPDVTVSTNLGAWVNQRGLFRRQRAGRRVRRRQDPLAAEMERQRGRPAYRARHRREQSVPDARRAGAGGRHFRRAAVPDRHRLRSRSSRAASMRSITPATRTRASCWWRRRRASRSGPRAARTSRSTRRLIAMGQPGLRHYEPAFVDELALADGGRLPADAGRGWREHLSPPDHAQHRPDRAAPTTAGRPARSRAAIGCASPRPARRRRSSIRARSCPRRSRRGKRSRTTCPASACSR